jgi:hypothetical protein
MIVQKTKVYFSQVYINSSRSNNLKFIWTNELHINSLTICFDNKFIWTNGSHINSLRVCLDFLKNKKKKKNQGLGCHINIVR